MSAGEHNSPEMRLLDYWDNFLAEIPTLPEVDPGASKLIRYLHEHDDAGWPSEEFVARTRELFARGLEQSGGNAELERGMIRPANPTPMIVVQELKWPRLSIWPIAAAMCVALGLGYFFIDGSLPARLADQWRDDPSAPALIAPVDLPGTPIATPEQFASPSVPQVLSQQSVDVTMLLNNPARLGDTNAVAPLELPEIDWSFATGSRMRSSPVLFDGVVYIGNTDGQMYAFDASNGDVVWQVDTGGSIISTALVAGDMVIVAAANTAQPGFVIAFDPATGAEAWRYPIGNQVSSDPLFYEGVVYLGSDDGFVRALNPRDGSEIWKVDTGAAVAFPAAAADGVFVVGNMDGILFALDAETGAERWRLEPDLVSLDQDPDNIANHTWSMPLIANGRVLIAYRPIKQEFVGSIVAVYATNLQSGEVQWVRTDLLGGGQQMLHWDNGVVRALTQGRNFATALVTFDPATGAEIGELLAIVLSSGTTLTEGVIAGDMLYMYIGASSNTTTAPAHLNVYELPSGNLMGRVDLAGAGPSGEMGDGRPPIIAGGRIYLGTSDGLVFALRTADDVPVATPQLFDRGGDVIVASSDLDASTHSTPFAEDSAPGTTISTQSLVLWNPNLFGAPDEVDQESIRVAPASSMTESTDIAGRVAGLPP